MSMMQEFRNAGKNVVYAVGVATLLGMAVGEVEAGAKVGAAFGVMMTLEQWSRRIESAKVSARNHDIA